MHLIIDGYGSDTRVLEDQELIYNLLDRYPAVIGMNKVAAPCVFRYIGANPDDWGLSGFVIIAESHISIHTFVKRGYVNIDVFSCREFDAQKVIRELKEVFKLHTVRTYILKRGLEYLEMEGAPVEESGVSS